MTIQTLREKYPNLTNEQIDDIRLYGETACDKMLRGLGATFDKEEDKNVIIRLSIRDAELNPIPENQISIFNPQPPHTNIGQ